MEYFKIIHKKMFPNRADLFLLEMIFSCVVMQCRIHVTCLSTGTRILYAQKYTLYTY
jgi:hypothetical protein